MEKHSILIYGGSKKGREEVIKNLAEVKEIKNAPDVKILDLLDEKKSIGIDEVREGIKFLQVKPFESLKKSLIILSADRLTTEAQNALLKTLEEPPLYAMILLSVKTENSLVDTVVSRCKKVRVGDSTEKTLGEENSFESFKKLSIGERLDFVEGLAKEEKEDLVEILEGWTREERGNLLNAKSGHAALARNLETLERIKNDLETTNALVKTALDIVALEIL